MPMLPKEIVSFRRKSYHSQDGRLDHALLAQQHLLSLPQWLGLRLAYGVLRTDINDNPASCIAEGVASRLPVRDTVFGAGDFMCARHHTASGGASVP